MREPPDRGKTVLLVEDVEDSRFMMRRLLEMDGHRVIEAADGREAVDIARRECPDLILMDLSLPVLDGLSATRLIRQLAGLCEVPIIAVSAYDRQDFYDAARAAGCDEYVTKPLDYDRLGAVMGRLLPRRVSPEMHLAGMTT